MGIQCLKLWGWLSLLMTYFKRGGANDQTCRHVVLGAMMLQSLLKGVKVDSRVTRATVAHVWFALIAPDHHKRSSKFDPILYAVL